MLTTLRNFLFFQPISFQPIFYCPSCLLSGIAKDDSDDCNLSAGFYVTQ